MKRYISLAGALLLGTVVVEGKQPSYAAAHKNVHHTRRENVHRHQVAEHHKNAPRARDNSPWWDNDVKAQRKH